LVSVLVLPDVASVGSKILEKPGNQLKFYGVQLFLHACPKRNDWNRTHQDTGFNRSALGSYGTTRSCSLASFLATIPTAGSVGLKLRA